MEETDNFEPFVDEAAFANQHRKRRVRYIVLFSVLAFFAAGYLIMTAVFHFCFLPNTVINGQNVSFQTVKHASRKLEDLNDSYSLHIYFRNGEAVIRKDDIGLIADSKPALSEVKKSQNPFLWFLFFKNEPYVIEYEVSYNEEHLKNLCDGLSYLDEEKMKEPEEPVIKIENRKAVCMEGDPGTSIDLTKFYDCLKNALSHLDSELQLEEEGCYREAEYTAFSPEVEEALSVINRYLSSRITYEYDVTNFTVQPEDIFDMIEIDDSYHCVLEKSRIRTYLEDFSGEHDTYGTDRSFTTHDGYSITVTGKKYGWLMDIETETDALYNDIKNGSVVSRPPAFTETGYVYKKGNDIGKTYAEVDLTAQHMYLYNNGMLVFESDFVSGCTNKGRGTPGGLYCVKYKSRNAVLRGEDYETPVSYWMPFNRGIGFHDADWRGAFGGNIYITNGSHGCINLPVSKARELYNLIEAGVPVVCYWR